MSKPLYVRGLHPDTSTVLTCKMSDFTRYDEIFIGAGMPLRSLFVKLSHVSFPRCLTASGARTRQTAWGVFGFCSSGLQKFLVIEELELFGLSADRNSIELGELRERTYLFCHWTCVEGKKSPS